MITKPTKLVLLAFYLFIYGSGSEIYALSSGVTPEVTARLNEIKEMRAEDPIRAITLIDHLLTYADLADEEKGWLHYEKGVTLKNDLDEKDEALLSLYKALRHFRQANAAEGQHRALRQLGHIYNALYHHSYALAYYQEIHSLRLKDKKDSLYNRYNIAYTYRLLEDFDTAIAIQKKLIVAFEEDSMLIDQMDSHLEMGVSYISLKNWEKAKEHYMIVDKLLSQFQGDPTRYKAKVLGSLGYIFMQEGNYIEAEDFLLQALPLMETENDLRMLVIHYNDLGLLETAKGNQDKALYYFKKSIELNHKKSDVDQIKSALSELISIHKERGETDKAFDYSQRLNELAVPFITLTGKLEKLHDRYKAETVHYTIEKFELQEALMEAKVRNTMIGAFLAGVLVISLFVYFRFRKRQHVDDDLIQNLKEKYRLLYLISEKYNIDLDKLDRQMK